MLNEEQQTEMNNIKKKKNERFFIPSIITFWREREKKMPEPFKNVNSSYFFFFLRLSSLWAFSGLLDVLCVEVIEFYTQHTRTAFVE